jgi:hypothetical protein
MTKMQKEKIILGYMKNLKIDRAEAEQLFEDDANDFITDEGEKMQEKAHDQRRYEPSEKNKKKRTVKKDSEKIKLITVLADFLSAEGLNPEIKNPQREIAFGDYSLTLTKHRKPKE